MFSRNYAIQPQFYRVAMKNIYVLMGILVPELALQGDMNYLSKDSLFCSGLQLVQIMLQIVTQFFCAQLRDR